MKRFLVFLLIIVFIIISAVIFKDLIIKSAVTTEASRLIGAAVQMDSFSLDIFNSSLRISGFKMYNPAGFPKGILINLPKINIIYDRDGLFKGKLHFIVAEIEIKEMEMLRNREGKLNVDGLKISQQQKNPAQPLALKIDRLDLGIGKIISRDYSSGGEPVVRAYELNIHKSYKNITSVQQLALLVILEPMKSAGIQNAKIYGIAALSGVAVLPVALAVKFTGKDSAQQSVAAGFERAYETGLGVLKRAGKVTKEDSVNGIIAANISGADVWFKLKREADNKTGITVSARKYLLPKPDIAGGILYQITEELQ